MLEKWSFIFHTMLGAPVAQWVKRWPTDTAYWSSGPSSIPARGKIFSTVNGALLDTAFHYQPLIVLIWLKHCWKGRKIAIHPSIHGHFHIKLEVQKMWFLGLISSQNKIYCSILHLHSMHMVVFYKWWKFDENRHCTFCIICQNVCFLGDQK